MTPLVNGAVSIAIAIVGVALLAVLVSRNANTTGVISASGSAFSQALEAATAPVTGNSPSVNSGFGLSLGGTTALPENL